MSNPVAYEVTPGYRKPTVKFVGHEAAQLAAKLWATCCFARDASFRIVSDTGEEYGTKRAGDVHGLDGVMTERCAECNREFRTARVGAPMCPGCELVATSEAMW